MAPNHKRQQTGERSQLETLTEAEEKLAKAFIRSQEKVRQRFPFWMALGATVGGVMVFTGLSRMVENVDWLNDNPWLMLVVGLVVLSLTGAVYRKL